MNKEILLALMETEFPRTLRVLKAFPAGHEDFRPHERSMSALQLALGFSVEVAAMKDIVRGQMDPSKFGYPAVSRIEEAIALYEKAHDEAVKDLKSVPEQEYSGTVSVMGRTMQRMDLLTSFVLDQIHHRGQFSVYLRMVGGKVPSIYGPSADDPGF